MSEHSTPEERTEMPTEKRMGQLRKEGSLPMSNDVVQVATLIGGFLTLKLCWEWFVSLMQVFMVDIFSLIGESPEFNEAFLSNLIWTVLREFGPPVMVIACAVSVIAVFATMLQTNWNIKSKWLDIRFDKMNPIAGISRIFSTQGFVNTGKAILKLSLILPIGYLALKAFSPAMVNLIHLSVKEVMAFMGLAIVQLFWKIMYVLIALAIFDLFWTRYQWLRNNKMTKDEVKDERKAIEGDERTKRQMQAKGLERIMQRIRQSVPQADVVITNPTHYAIALKYDRNSMDAPVVVAKGKGFLALRIRELAKASNVPVLERKTLARALYRSTEVGATIPYELFKAVAEVLAYVYRLKNPYKYQTQAQR